jgi:DNA polymerase IIIc chi subunit
VDLQRPQLPAARDPHCRQRGLPQELAAYERIAEIVDADPGRKQRARERYRLYRERGCALESHNISGE